MWMVGGYNESSHHHHHPHHHPQVSLGPHDAFNAAATRKLRPLIPRPPVVFPSSTSCASATTTHSCNFGLYTGSDLFSLNHPLGGGGDHQGSNYKNKELSNINVSAVPQVVLSTSRWNPTPEQLRTLEDLYRRGTRTPSTEQIQRITAELRRYGKIEGKNVFYWFQNHKARERQKRRRELELLSHDHPNQHHHEPVVERKERGPANGKQGFEGEQTRSHYSNASATHAQEAGVGESMQRAAAAAAKAGRRAAAAVSDHRSRHNTGRLFHLELDDERTATWHNHIPSSSTPFCYSASTNSPPTPPSMATCDITRIGTKTRRFIPSLKEPIRDTTKEYEADEVEEGSATLQLFPLRSQVESEVEEEDKSKERDDVHFFEFLPPKIN